MTARVGDRIVVESREGGPGGARRRDPRGHRSVVRDPLPGPLGRRPREHDPAIGRERPDHRRAGIEADLIERSPAEAGDLREGDLRPGIAPPRRPVRRARTARPAGPRTARPAGPRTAGAPRVGEPGRGAGRPGAERAGGAVPGAADAARRARGPRADPVVGPTARDLARRPSRSEVSRAGVPAAGPGRHPPVLGGAKADRLGGDGAVGLEARDDFDGDHATEEPLDVVQERRLVDADERDRHRRPRRPARSGRSGGRSPRGPSAARS